jgi:hypothetical protein
MSNEYEVVIIGAGVAGSSTAYWLARAGIKNICVIESGVAGIGSSAGTKIVRHAQLREGDNVNMEGKIQNSFPTSKFSGTIVLPGDACSCKMIITVYPCSSEQFISHHGQDGAESFLKLSAEGLKMQTELSHIVNVPARTLGSLYCCEEQDVPRLRREFEILQELGNTYN